jgi:uncharacterized protein (DUF952 family)
VLYHITSPPELARARAAGEYRPARFADEGFSHGSYLRQVTAVANRLFRGRADLVLLEIDPARLTCRIVDENLEGGAELYPHIYGPLPMSAVVRVDELSCAVDGALSLPPDLRADRS